MCNKLLLLFLVTYASGKGILDTLIGGFTNSVNSTVTIPETFEPQDAYLSITELVEKYGYRIEAHTVATEDGYLLDMHRIWQGNATSNGKTIFLMHGIWESSDSWVLQGPRKALAYILADEGFDVWIGNARGNRHGLLHKNLTADMSEFWEFSWEEIGFYDLPAMIDHILEFTCEDSIYYVGFSQGTTSYFVMNSMRPEYNKKIKLMFALAPEVFLGNAKNVLLKMFSPASSFLPYFMWNFNIYSPSTEFFNLVTPLICNLVPIRCENFFFSVVGPHNVEENLWPVILGHVPTGSSTLQFIHYGQLANSKRFRRFDFGIFKNFQKYGRLFPPDYDVKAVTSPIFLFHSGNDWFSDYEDVELLKKILPNVIGSYYIKQFSHVDFMYAEEASTLVYNNIISQIKNHCN